MEKNPLSGELERELATVLNCHGWDNKCNMPDFILADYLVRCLYAMLNAQSANEDWHKPKPPPAKGEL